LEAKLKFGVREMNRLTLGGVAALLISTLAVASAAADDAATCVAKGPNAIAACDNWIRQEPKNAIAYWDRGDAYQSVGDFDRAISDFTQAIELDPKYALAYDRRGQAYYGKHEYDRAMADFEKEIKLNPEYGPSYNNRGLVYEAMGDVVRAFAGFDQAIRLNPNGAGAAYTNRGRVYEGRGDHDRAIADFNQSIKINPNYARAYHFRGFTYSNKSEYDRAIADLEEAIRLEPTDRLARQYLERATAARAAPPTNPPAPATKLTAAEVRVALVIGNSAYQSAAYLPNPRRDAQAVADALRRAGFQIVQLATDLDHDAMTKALRSFRDRADTADWALIYFAGHGIEINGVNYLIPVDAKLADEREVEAETVPYEDLLSTVGRAKMLRLIILDACRVNPFKDRMRRAGTLSRGGSIRGLAPPPESEPGTLVVYSAKDGEVAADDVDGVNSPFARAFLQEVKVPGREVRRLFDYVRDDVIDATDNRQEPFTYGSLPGRRDFFFVPAN
jgi:tetratricopeptide (TPR) repeat protein